MDMMGEFHVQKGIVPLYYSIASAYMLTPKRSKLRLYMSRVCVWLILTHKENSTSATYGKDILGKSVRKNEDLWNDCWERIRGQSGQRFGHNQNVITTSMERTRSAHIRRSSDWELGMQCWAGFALVGSIMWAGGMSWWICTLAIHLWTYDYRRLVEYLLQSAELKHHVVRFERLCLWTTDDRDNKCLNFVLWC